LNKAHVKRDGVKVVLGPGTGLGEAMLAKSDFAPCHEVLSSEGGHVDYPPKSKEDFKIFEFSKNYIATSNNVENLRAKSVITRVSMERVCAGPAIPMLYEFYKQEYPDLPRYLEEGADGIKPDDMTSTHIVSKAMTDKEKDPLCQKVIEKFTEIFATECGNLGLRALPFGGIYLVGGVTVGITDFLVKSEHFKDHFFGKGRFEDMMRRLPLMVIKGDVELGLLGAEECTYRMLGRYKDLSGDSDM